VLNRCASMFSFSFIASSLTFNFSTSFISRSFSSFCDL
jgi:hypothetical protein